MLRCTAGASFTGSDNAYASGTEWEYQQFFFAKYHSSLWRLPLFSVYGNHDALTSSAAHQSGPYFLAFTMPTKGQSGGARSHNAAYYR